MYDDYEDDQPVTRIKQNAASQKKLGSQILKDAEIYLEDISADEHTLLIKTLTDLAAQDAYFQVLADELNQPEDAKIANDALNLVHFWQLINQTEDVNDFNLLDVVNDTFFKDELFKAFDDLSQNANSHARRAVIEQALQMYKLGFYAGCVPLLYAQLEGLLTDVLLAQGFLSQKDTKFLDVYKIVPGLKGNEIKSLWHKAKIATEMNAYFAELAAYKMDSSSNVSMTRHNILHGTDVAHFTQARSFILLLWLFSVTSFMRSIR
ncbi:hypothetical protein [uncultured Acinetobacter sp.]|uniref:hypothetical protein n=1 Tax=uncultured Acinetobacter sp. TaxID=165433 RepID=UPI0026344BBD|nr:hypothetical protein [uncultured Acinetobacter sp.]